MKRILVVGDIHGSLKALIQCLQRSRHDPKKDMLVFLGDYVDGWSESAQLISYLIQLEKDSIYKPIFIKGNHDDWARDWLLYGIKRDSWLLQGGQSTYDSYVDNNLLSDEEHQSFFRNLHHYYLIDDILFLHAGFTSHRGIEGEIYRSNLWWDRTLWEAAIGSKRVTDPLHIPRRFYNYKEIYIGHTATVNWDYKKGWDENGKIGTPIITPMNSHNVWNLDTGCGFRGKLSIMDINTKEYWQSDLVKDLYPEEEGRGEFKRKWKT